MSRKNPTNLKDAKSIRSTSKRSLSILIKNGEALLNSTDGIPRSEFDQLSDSIKIQLEHLQWSNEHVITFRCKDLNPEDYTSEDLLEDAESAIAKCEENYYSGVVCIQGGPKK